MKKRLVILCAAAICILAAAVWLFSPKAAVISCGRKNVYGHPAAEVLQRLAAAGCKTLRTDTQGSVILQRKGGRIRIKTLPP